MDEDKMDVVDDSGPMTEGDRLRERRRQEIPFSRRLELQKFAGLLASQVLESTKPHERCLLNNMVQNLLPRE